MTIIYLNPPGQIRLSDEERGNYIEDVASTIRELSDLDKLYILFCIASVVIEDCPQDYVAGYLKGLDDINNKR